MGIYDRDYYRPAQSAPFSAAYRPRSIVISLIVVNCAIWLADGLFFGGMLRNFMAVHVAAAESPLSSGDTLTHPWLWWQFLTAGFAHAAEFQHLFFNMLIFFFLGRDVEERYSSREFLRLYLVMVVFSSLVWALISKINYTDPVACYGASGAISGVVILFALNFPHRTLLLFFVIPAPAWVIGVLYVLLDMFGAFGATADTNVAYTAHLAGTAFAFVYFQLQWNISQKSDALVQVVRSVFHPKPRLKIHEPDKPADADLSDEVDRILAKIHREGEAALTAKERRTLENASREYQRRRR
ncbi:MAG: rhomboid family intramembrane serine protease [Pirellulaceae bacterium]|nr:rhomboid family intramembrane serine protease [Pirellulaceae bacterium]